jgi:hypothetical protein
MEYIPRKNRASVIFENIPDKKSLLQFLPGKFVPGRGEQFIVMRDREFVVIMGEIFPRE